MTRGFRSPSSRWSLLVAALAAVPWLVSDYGLGFMVNLMCYLVLTVAWALFSGTTRYVSLATAAFFGVGAYTVAMLVKEMPIYACFGVALVVGTVMALLVGLVTLRISGMFFVIFGFGLSELMRELLVWWEINQTHTMGRYVFVPFDTTLIYEHLLGLAVLVFLVGWLVAAVAARHRAAGDRRRRDHGAPGRHQRAVRQGDDLRRLVGVHDDGRRDHGAALRLSDAELRLQPADLVPGRDHGAARRHAAAVGTGARRRAADRCCPRCCRCGFRSGTACSSASCSW